MIKYIFTFIALVAVISCNSQNNQGAKHNEDSHQDTEIQMVNSTGFNRLLEDQVTAIDVRTPGEIAEGYIPGTLLFIDFNGPVFEAEIDKLDKNQPYVVYCRSGNRSRKALNIMKAKGFTKLYELEGGINAWQGELSK